MALFTKLFKRDHDPYTIPARWIKIHFKGGEIVPNEDSVLYDAEIISTTGTTSALVVTGVVIDWNLVVLNPDPSVTYSWTFGSGHRHQNGKTGPTFASGGLTTIDEFDVYLLVKKYDNDGSMVF